MDSLGWDDRSLPIEENDRLSRNLSACYRLGIPKASYSGKVVAETDTFEEVDGNVYFPPHTIVSTHFEESEHTSHCSWKGTAKYYHVVVDGQRNENAAWHYPDPLPKAANIKGHIAFWKGVTVER